MSEETNETENESGFGNTCVTISSAIRRVLKNRNLTAEKKLMHIADIVAHYDALVAEQYQMYELPKELIALLVERMLIREHNDYSIHALHTLQFVLTSSIGIKLVSKMANINRYLDDFRFLNNKPSWVKFIYSRIINWDNTTQGTLYSMRIIAEVKEFYGYKSDRLIKKEISNARAWYVQYKKRKERKRYMEFQKIVDDANDELKRKNE